ncbi:MAG: peptidylprolyl isomerase [Microthrixaceae bacterium]
MGRASGAGWAGGVPRLRADGDERREEGPPTREPRGGDGCTTATHEPWAHRRRGGPRSRAGGSGGLVLRRGRRRRRGGDAGHHLDRAGGGRDGPRTDHAGGPGVADRLSAPERSPERYTTFEAPPTICIDPATTAYSAEVNTTEGSFTIELDAEAAPRTVNNFVVLARYRYYDGVPFHRIVPGFVIQAGDGDGTPDGSNDIGYTIDDELPGSADAYVDYSVAMANAGPDTGATQFFVVLPGGGAQLTNAYSLFGRVTEGTEVVDAIGDLGGPDQKPTEDVLIEDVRIVERPR